MFIQGQSKILMEHPKQNWYTVVRLVLGLRGSAWHWQCISLFAKDAWCRVHGQDAEEDGHATGDLLSLPLLILNVRPDSANILLGHRHNYTPYLLIPERYFLWRLPQNRRLTGLRPSKAYASAWGYHLEHPSVKSLIYLRTEQIAGACWFWKSPGKIPTAHEAQRRRALDLWQLSWGRYGWDLEHQMASHAVLVTACWAGPEHLPLTVLLEACGCAVEQ